MVASTVGVVAQGVVAGATTTTIATESFAGTTLSQPWALLATPFGDNAACLTNPDAATGATPVPGCGATTPGVDGLQLTQLGANKTGGVAYGVSVPTADGLDATFDSYQWGATAGNGLTFFLAATNPVDPSVGRIGKGGGHLGYSGGFATPTGSGLADAYLGVGLDVSGKFATSQYAGSEGCTHNSGTSAKAPDAVDVRGPGNGTDGYCLLASTAQGTALDGALSSASPTPVPVQVALNPSTAAIAVTGLEVPPQSWALAVSPIVAPETTGPSQGTCPAGARCLTGSLPSASHASCPATTGGNGEIPAGTIPCTWLNAAGVPDQLVFGWTGSTAGSADNHVVTDASVKTLTGVPPSYELTLEAGTGGHSVATGETVPFHAQATVESTREYDRITIADLVPAGLTAVPADDTLVGGSCATSTTTATGVLEEVCTYTPGIGGVAAGTTLTATFYATVSQPELSTARSIVDRAVVSSGDGSPAFATATVAFAPQWSIGLQDSAPSGVVVPGTPVEFTATPDFSTTGAAEADTLTLVDTLPAELVPSSSSGTGWACGISGQEVTCTLAAPGGGFPAGATAPLHIFTTAEGPTRGAQTDVITLSSSDGGAASATSTVDVVTNALVFLNQPTTVQLNGTMKQQTTPLQIQVAIESTGAPISSVSGPQITLHLTPNPGSAKFEVNGGAPTSTLVATVEDGIATFPAFGLTKTGSGYRLVATSTGVAGVTSTAFGSYDTVSSCATNTTCRTTIPTTSGVHVTVTVPNSTTTTVVVGNFGTTLHLLYGCPAGTIHQIVRLTAGAQAFIVVYQQTLPKQIRHVGSRAIPFCLGSTTTFRTSTGHTATFDPTNNEYEGALPTCRATRQQGPCIQSERFAGRTVTFTVMTAGGDPRFDSSG